MTAPVKLTFTENEWLAQVLDLAKLFRWTRAHFRPAQTTHGWRTAVQGDGEGFPDLVLVRPPRLILAELKSQTGKLTDAQEAWLALLEGCETPLSKAGVEVYCWRPAQLEQVQAILR